MKSLKSLQEIIFPVRCLGCSALGLEICSQCRSKWNPHIYRSWSRTSPYFPIFSSIQYSTVASKVLLAAKENNIKLADDLLVQALQRSFHFCAKERGVGVLVPIPSRHAVARSRGRQFITELSLRLSKGTGIETIEMLSHIRKVRDQSSLDAKQRLVNIEGSMKSLRYLSEKVILVDDLVTTGATIHEGARALRENGIEVIAAVTACIAEPLR
ncbi:ComFC Predicted amidophosphoribosyltransferases [Candidatus Nanopelagicaceae bacterium]|jgi:predicted amidophosphoribosyltransferase